METIADLDARIRAYEQQIEEMANSRYPQTELLRQVAGVGPTTATMFVLTVEAPTRFTRARGIGSYLGLRPRQDESGSLKPQLHLTKAGDASLRTMLSGRADKHPTGIRKRYGVFIGGSPACASFA